MSIAINAQLCRGCGACTNVCPGSLIKRDSEGKAYIKYGGMGSCLTVCTKGDELLWKIKRTGGEETQIVVNKKESNKY